MALQLLKRNYTMQGYEAPKILKLPQGETRWAPRRLPVDVGDVMMNIRMDDSKNRYIGEHVSKYAQGLNPYGEWGYPYKINKNNIRPPIIDPKYYQALSRMPVKFDSVTAGPIVKDLYGKRVEIAKVAPQTIIDRICPDAAPRVSGQTAADDTYREGGINLHLKQPRSSIPYHPSIPVQINTGVPQVELDGKIIVRPQAGIHAPFTVSDQTRDVNNMRTPMHVAFKPGYKDPYTFIQATPNDIYGVKENVQNIATGTGYNPGYTLEPVLNQDGIELTPKVQTSAWYNPNFYTTSLGPSIGNVGESCIDEKVRSSAQSRPSLNLIEATERQMSERVDPMIGNPIHTAMKAPSTYRMVDHSGHDVPITTRQTNNTSCHTNVGSRLRQEGELGTVSLPDAIHAGQFEGKAVVPSIQNHPEYNRARAGTGQQEYFFVSDHPNNQEMHQQQQPPQIPRLSGIKDNRLQLQAPRVDRSGLEPEERVIPVGTGRFIHNPF